MDKGIILAIIWVVLTICLLGLFKAHINRMYGKRPCKYCGEKIFRFEDHWCEGKIQKIRDQQLEQIFDQRSKRKINVSWYCPSCKKTRHRAVVYDMESALSDKNVVIESFCGGCERLVRI